MIKSMYSLFLLMAFFSQLSAQHEVKITVKNLEKEGKIYAAISSDADKFMDNALQRKIFPLASSGETIVTFSNLKPGKYAVYLFQDENGNGKLDKNPFGAPTEPYGFSNNPTIRFSAPSFKDCAFDVKGNTIQTINLK